MYTKTTHSVEVAVMPEYDSKNSLPNANKFIFRYTITIKNKGNAPIKIHKRKWLIYDFGRGITEVKGDGVIGLTPEINPQESFTYFSFVPLEAPVGYMQGSFLIEVDDHNDLMEIDIPRFNLVSDILNN